MEPKRSIKSTRRPNVEQSFMRPFSREVGEQKAQELATLLKEQEALEKEAEHFRGLAKSAADKATEKKARAFGLKSDILSGQHLVQIECEWSLGSTVTREDGQKIITWTWSLTTLEGKASKVVRTEPSTMTDRQHELDLTPEAPPLTLVEAVGDEEAKH